MQDVAIRLSRFIAAGGLFPADWAGARQLWPTKLLVVAWDEESLAFDRRGDAVTDHQARFAERQDADTAPRPERQ